MNIETLLLAFINDYKETINSPCKLCAKMDNVSGSKSQPNIKQKLRTSY